MNIMFIIYLWGVLEVYQQKMIYFAFLLLCCTGRRLCNGHLTISRIASTRMSSNTLKKVNDLVANFSLLTAAIPQNGKNSFKQEVV